jgi:hypothetical protein
MKMGRRSMANSSPPKIDVRDDLTRRRSRRLHCRFHHWAVSAVEHYRDALTEQSMWTAKLAVDCAQ